MKRNLLLSSILILVNLSLNAATGWYSDYVLINSNNAGISYYWIGANPSYGTQLQGNNFGEVNSLVITGCDMRYWGDGGDRTGGAFYFQIRSSDGINIIKATTETIWEQSSLGGNNFQGLKNSSINLLSGLTAGTSYQLHVWAKSWGSSQGDSYLSNYSANYVATFTYTPTIFTGTADWTSASNWSHGVPLTTSNAIISGNATISTNVIVDDLTINSGSVLNINSGKSLTVSGTLTNSAGAGGLVVKSGGSLISSNGAEATVERFLTQYNAPGDKMFHFLSSPVSNQAIRTEFVTTPITAGHDFYSFNELTNTWINSKASDGSWNGSFDATFLIGKGYLVAYPDTITKKFKGTLNSYPSESPLELNCTNTAGQGNGWNLLGNPFPSPIDWALITKGDGIDNALYYYDNAQQNYRYYLQLGSIGSLGGGSQYIPAMQGFMVHANTTGTNKKVIISNTARTHTGQNVFYKSVNTELKGISLKASANGYEDEAIIYFLDGATAGFDGEYDAFKLKSYSVNVPMISTTSSDGNELAINGLPAFDKANVIPVNFKADLAGDYTLSANLLSFNDNEVYLTDKKLNQDLKISENPVYTFTSEAGDDPNRFELRFMTPTGLEKTSTKSSLRVYTTNGKINISGVDGKAEVYVRNIVGQVFLRNSVNGSTLQSFNTSNLPAGIYMVSVVSATKTVSQKVVVK